MRPIAVAIAAAAALAISTPAAAAVTVADYTATGPGTGTFTLEYDSTTDAYTLIAMSFTLGSTTFTTSTAGISPFNPPPHPFAITTVGGDVSGVTGIVAAANADDFWFDIDPTLASQSVPINYMVFGGQITFATETITGEVIRGPSFAPEPGTWAMMLLGFGAIGLTLRRRRTPALA